MIQRSKSSRWLLALASIASLAFSAVTLAATPDLNGGTWQAIDSPQALRTTQGKEPPLLPAAKAIYLKNIAARKAGDLSFDGTEKCLPPGLPRMLTMPATLGRFEFLQRPEQIVIGYEWNRVWRIVGMKERPEYIAPGYAGRSQGHWEARTLVIDSTDFVETTLLDNAGLPHSDALHVVERYTPSSDGKQMQLRLRIEDPKTFSAPWETTLNLRHDPAGKIQEDDCLERKDIAWGKDKNAAN